MKKFYISSTKGLSGICKYSHDFYELILKEKGYILIESIQSLTAIMSAVSSIDHAHIEIGLFQKKEVEILFAMLNSGYRNVSVTMHDAPLLKYPYREFENKLLNNFSKFYDKYINRFMAVLPWLKKIKSIYVLSQKGAEAMRTKYKLDNVYFLPHIVNTAEIEKGKITSNNFIYFGFIGRNKGIEYALELHSRLLHHQPDIDFYIVGGSIGKEQLFYEALKKKYSKNVHYLGYVAEEELGLLFNKATFAMLLFKDYQFYWPFSGSILYSMKKGKIILTNKVNSIPEIICDKENGFFLSEKIEEDTRLVKEFIDNKMLLQEVNNATFSYLLKNHTSTAVNSNFID